MGRFAVQPATWAELDEHGAVYCVDMETAHRIARDQLRFGDQIIWKLGTKQAMKWVRVTVDEVVTSA